MYKIQRFNQIIISLAHKNDVVLVDLHTVFKPLHDNNISFTTDGVHQSKASYRLMKEALLEKLIN